MSFQWQSKAVCRDEEPEMFFRNGTTMFDAIMTADAKDVCFACPVRAQCVEWIMRLEGGAGQTNRFGVYGGMTPNERDRLYRRRLKEKQRGRVSQTDCR